MTERLEDRLNALETENSLLQQTTSEFRHVVTAVDKVFASLDGHMKEIDKQLKQHSVSKATELGLFSNATKSLRDTVEVLQMPRNAVDDDEDNDDIGENKTTTYQAGGLAELQKMFVEYFGRPQWF